MDNNIFTNYELLWEELENNENFDLSDYIDYTEYYCER